MATKSTAALRSGFRALLRSNEEAIINKLLRNEERYKFGNGWKKPDWQQKLQSDLPHHVAKGDARDVVILGNMAMYHGWSTAPDGASRWVPTTHSLPTPPVGTGREYWVVINERVSKLHYAYELDMDENHDEQTYTGWMDDKSDFAYVEPDMLYPYHGALPTHWMEVEPTPALPVDVRNAIAYNRPEPKFGVGETVKVEVFSAKDSAVSLGKHAAHIEKRIWLGRAQGWAYEPDFLYKHGADGVEWEESQVIAEQHIQALTDDEHDAFVMSAHALAPTESVTQTQAARLYRDGQSVRVNLYGNKETTTAKVASAKVAINGEWLYKLHFYDAKYVELGGPSGPYYPESRVSTFGIPEYL